MTSTPRKDWTGWAKQRRLPSHWHMLRDQAQAPDTPPETLRAIWDTYYKHRHQFAVAHNSFGSVWDYRWTNQAYALGLRVLRNPNFNIFGLYNIAAQEGDNPPILNAIRNNPVWPLVALEQPAFMLNLVRGGYWHGVAHLTFNTLHPQMLKMVGGPPRLFFPCDEWRAKFKKRPQHDYTSLGKYQWKGVQMLFYLPAGLWGLAEYGPQEPRVKAMSTHFAIIWNKFHGQHPTFCGFPGSCWGCKPEQIRDGMISGAGLDLGSLF